MIRLTSQTQALSLRGKIPELAICRSLQFQDNGNGYDPDIHGVIYVVEPGDDIEALPEIGPEGLFDEDGLPCFEFVECFIEEDGSQVFELVVVLSNDKVVAMVIPDDPSLDPSLRTILRHAAGAPQPLPNLERNAL